MTYLLLFFMYGLAQTPFAFLLSTFFSKGKTSVCIFTFASNSRIFVWLCTLVSYFLVMIFCGLGSALQMIGVYFVYSRFVLFCYSSLVLRPIYSIQVGGTSFHFTSVSSIMLNALISFWCNQISVFRPPKGCVSYYLYHHGTPPCEHGISLYVFWSSAYLRLFAVWGPDIPFASHVCTVLLIIIFVLIKNN